MINMGDMNDFVSPAELAELDQLDAITRDRMGQPFGGMWDLNVGGAVLPFLDDRGAVGVVRVATTESDYRECTACADAAQRGNPAAECGRQAELTARYGFAVEHACDRDRADMLKALRPLVMGEDHPLG